MALRLYLQKDVEGSEAKHAVAFHTQNAMRRLRERLRDADAYQDDVIVWAVIMLCGTTVCSVALTELSTSLLPAYNLFQYILQEIDAFKAHVQGLRQMVGLRGGIDSLDKFGFFKRRVIKYVQLICPD